MNDPLRKKFPVAHVTSHEDDSAPLLGRRPCLGSQLSGVAEVASASGGVAQALACLGQSRRFELDYLAAKRAARNRVDVVKVDDAVCRDAIVGRGEFEFGDETADGSCDCCRDDGSDVISNWISCEYEDGALWRRSRGLCPPASTATKAVRPGRPDRPLVG